MPSSLVQIGLVQMRMSDDVDSNLEKALEGVRKAAKKGAEIVCLPELFAWRYFPSRRGESPPAVMVPGPITSALSRTARDSNVVLVGGTVYEQAEGRRYNTCIVFDQDGKAVSKYRKVHIPQDEHYFEQDYFSAGARYFVARTGKGVVGTLVCFDQWYPEPARIERLLGAEVLFYPTAIGWVKGIEPVEGDWKMAWEAVQVGHAISNSMAVCAVNRVGVEDGTTFWGGSFVCDQFGRVLFRADGREGVHVVACDLGLGKVVDQGWGFMRNRHQETYSRIAK